MAGEVDRLLSWMDRVEKLEADLEKPGSVDAELIRARLEWAQKAQSTALGDLVSAAHRGDPEALVALDALEDQIEEMTWSLPRSAA
jgi:hypothetical protein